MIIQSIVLECHRLYFFVFARNLSLQLTDLRLHALDFGVANTDAACAGYRLLLKARACHVRLDLLAESGELSLRWELIDFFEIDVVGLEKFTTI